MDGGAIEKHSCISGFFAGKLDESKTAGMTSIASNATECDLTTDLEDLHQFLRRDLSTKSSSQEG